ncbi:acetyl-CoA synthetase-like protein [Basidiobolus meristosporus CBS 931.73]|uniref:Acetyl-CoA synthetase-like protein n=1 Tax=Basidiobolus meristosporus CBS 931.73 TaxID=1314790 RepID=A0A1Y1YFM3_9FUNG|nr:acetyl-CoA synthetase-like protein [Basidiobolus meristosporus CBS 931.73]|eukprot:ORX96787.1 acetyl-CoA synthetase-like protein [Basidiobolus meristosporus CBS 931.73]
MIHTSLLPPVDIPAVDIFTYMFELPAVRSPESTVIVNGQTGKTYSFADVKNNALAFAAGITRKYDFKTGDVLGIFAPNAAEYSTICFGALAAGGTVTTANPSYTPEEFSHQLKQTLPKIIVTISELIPVVKKAMELSNLKCVLITLEPSEDKAVPSLVDVMSDATGFKRVVVEPSKLGTTVAYICYSSGTSGNPKGVMLSHRNIVSNVQQQKDIAFGKEEEVIIGVLPFYHIYGLSCIMHTPLKRQDKVVVLPKFDFIEFLTLIQKYKITTAMIVPPIALALAKHPIVKKFDVSSLRTFTSGAAPLDKNLSMALSAAINNAEIRQGFGMTETAPVATLNIPPNIKHGSIGMLVPNQEAKIVDPNGKELGINEEGELWVRGPNIMMGYLHNPEATKETIDSDGFLHTGDIAKVDESGVFFITDRIKELIKYKGFQVAPAELEALLISHPAVLDAGVIPRNDPQRATEVPKAFVVLSPGVERSEKLEKELIAFVDSKVASHKKLRGGIEFIDEIPKSAAGKIQRRQMKEWQRQKDEKIKAKL